MKTVTLIALVGCVISFIMWQLINWGIISYTHTSQTNMRIYNSIGSIFQIIPLVIFFGFLYSKQPK